MRERFVHAFSGLFVGIISILVIAMFVAVVDYAAGDEAADAEDYSYYSVNYPRCGHVFISLYLSVS